MRNRAASKKNAPEARQGETNEQIGGLSVVQPRRGYRYGIDPFLLADFILPRLREKVVDLGTGCGIVALLLAVRWPSLKIWGIELQPGLARLAEENVRRNNLASRFVVHSGDARQIHDLLPAGRFQRVISNPPFRPPRSGRISPEPQRALARQELAFSLADLAGTAAYLLDHGGILDFIHLPERLPEIFRILHEKKLQPKKLRLVHSFVDAEPEMALVSARKNGRPGLKTLPPLIVFNSPGSYTDEIKEVFSGRGVSSKGLSC